MIVSVVAESSVLVPPPMRVQLRLLRLIILDGSGPLRLLF